MMLHRSVTLRIDQPTCDFLLKGLLTGHCVLQKLTRRPGKRHKTGMATSSQEESAQYQKSVLTITSAHTARAE